MMLRITRLFKCFTDERGTTLLGTKEGPPAGNPCCTGVPWAAWHRKRPKTVKLEYNRKTVSRLRMPNNTILWHDIRSPLNFFLMRRQNSPLSLVLGRSSDSQPQGIRDASPKSDAMLSYPRWRFAPGWPREVGFGPLLSAPQGCQWRGRSEPSGCACHRCGKRPPARRRPAMRTKRLGCWTPQYRRAHLSSRRSHLRPPWRPDPVASRRTGLALQPPMSQPNLHTKPIGLGRKAGCRSEGARCDIGHRHVIGDSTGPMRCMTLTLALVGCPRPLQQ